MHRACGALPSSLSTVCPALRAQHSCLIAKLGSSPPKRSAVGLWQRMAAAAAQEGRPPFTRQTRAVQKEAVGVPRPVEDPPAKHAGHTACPRVMPVLPPPHPNRAWHVVLSMCSVCGTLQAGRVPLSCLPCRPCPPSLCSQGCCALCDPKTSACSKCGIMCSCNLLTTLQSTCACTTDEGACALQGPPVPPVQQRFMRGF